MVEPMNFQPLSASTPRASVRPDLVLTVSLRVSGDELDPNSVTEVLRLRPTESAKKGELLRARGSHQLMSQSGVWFGRIERLPLMSGDPLPSTAALAPGIVERLKLLPGCQDIVLSFLLNGPEVIVSEFVDQNAAELAERMSLEAAYVDVDLDAPTAGLEIVLGVGDSLEAGQLRQQAGLSARQHGL